MKDLLHEHECNTIDMGYLNIAEWYQNAPLENAPSLQCSRMKINVSWSFNATECNNTNMKHNETKCNTAGKCNENETVLNAKVYKCIKNVCECNMSECSYLE